MRILYGVVGEGMGHATRSKVVIDHLESGGHEVMVVVSGRAAAFLAKSFSRVVEIRGLEISYLDGAMNRDATVAKNVLAAPAMMFENMRAYYEDVTRFDPQAVVSDFESFAYLYARRHALPIVSIDNQQIISRCWHDPEILEGHSVDFETTKAFIRVKLPGCDHYVVTTFFYPDVKEKYRDNTTLVPPILRDVVLRATPSGGEHVIVYQTSTSDTALLDVLAQHPEQKFVVYGLRRDEQIGHCVLKSFSEEGFIADLASSRAVIANGGLSLLGEALYLGKPVYSVPVRHQFEQVMNARYLTRQGFGMSSLRFDTNVLGAFLRDAPHFARHVRAQRRQQGNDTLFAIVDEVMRRFASRPSLNP